MVTETTRRDYLRVAGGVAAITGIGATVPSLSRAESDDCPELDELLQQRAQLEATLADRIDEIEALEAAIPALESDLLQARDTWRSERIQYPDHIRSQLLDVGMDARESVIQLEIATPDGSYVSSSTAWYIDEYHLLTNAHNVHGIPPTAELAAWTHGGERITFDILGSVDDERPDVALIKTDHSGTPLDIGTTDALSDGDVLAAVGHPGVFGNWVITAGEFIEFTDVGPTGQPLTFGSSVPGMPGSSGSPTLNLAGEVVGMLRGGAPGNPPSIPPQPAPLEVRTEPMVAEGTMGLHVPIETAMEYVTGWR